MTMLGSDYITNARRGWSKTLDRAVELYWLGKSLEQAVIRAKTEALLKGRI